MNFKNCETGLLYVRTYIRKCLAIFTSNILLDVNMDLRLLKVSINLLIIFSTNTILRTLVI